MRSARRPPRWARRTAGRGRSRRPPGTTPRRRPRRFVRPPTRRRAAAHGHRARGARGGLRGSSGAPPRLACRRRTRRPRDETGHRRTVRRLPESPPVLSARELNRATLARQLLLERSDLEAETAIERLAGLQAQLAMPPFVGLWTRLADFRRDPLNELIAERRVVRAHLMRSTLHLVSARDYLSFRSVLQPALERAYRGFFGTRSRGLDLDPIAAAAREHVEREPRAFGELTKLLTELDPDRDANALAFGARMRLAMVQTPTPGATWGYGNAPRWALPEQWLGQPVDSAAGSGELIRRYLGAFGPARVADVQTWAGMTGLREAVDALRPELVALRDENGNELLDLPEASRPGGDAPAPVRLLPDYDNLVLSHADRTRFVPDEHRRKVLRTAGRVSATFLVGGVVA